MNGVVRRVPDPLKNFGFIRGLDDAGRNIRDDVFFHVSQCQKDCIGRHHLKSGDKVEFDLVEVNGKCRAENVVNLSALDIDPISHREWSFISNWSPADGPEPALGWMERDTGDQIALFPEDIANFESIESHIRVGLWVYHGVGQKKKSGKWYASDAIVRLPELDGETDIPEPAFQVDTIEHHFLSAPELPLAEPAPEHLKPGDVYLPSEKKLSLKQLIARRSVA